MKYNIPQQLLFFRFKEFEKYNKVLLTNIVWDYLVVWKTQFNKIIKWNFSKNLQRKLEKNWFWKNNENIKNIISAYRNKNSYLTWWPTLHIIVLTKWCNLNCIYCHSKATGNEINKYQLNKEIADKYIDIIFTSTSKHLTIEFQGGEPTLNWDILTYIVKKSEDIAKKKDKTINFTTTTNLYKISTEQINYMIEHNFSINTSIDGNERIQNINRPSFPSWNSFNRIKENVEKIQKIEKEKKYKLLNWWIAVITRKWLEEPENISRTYKGLNLNYIFVKYLDWLGRNQIVKDSIWYTWEEFINFYKRHLEEIKKINLWWYKLVDGFLHIFLKKIIAQKNPNYVDLQNPCGAGIWQVAYNYDGGIYTCDEWRTLDEDVFKLWDRKSIDNVKQIVQNETTANVCNCSCLESNVCDMCAYQPYCGICPVHNYINHWELFVDIRDTFRHKFNSFIQDFVFEKIIINDKKWLNIFKSWLK